MLTGSTLHATREAPLQHPPSDRVPAPALGSLCHFVLQSLPLSARPPLGRSSAGRPPPAPTPSRTAGAPLGRRPTKSERKGAKAARLDTDPEPPAAAPRGPLDPPVEVHLRRAWAADLVSHPAVYAQEHCSCPSSRRFCPSPQLYPPSCLCALVSPCSPTGHVGARPPLLPCALFPLCRSRSSLAAVRAQVPGPSSGLRSWLR